MSVQQAWSGIRSSLESFTSFQEKLREEQAQLAAAEAAAADQATLHAAVLEAAYLVAMADGAISESEADALSHGIWELTNQSITQDQLQALFEVAVGRSQNEGADARFDGVARELPDPEWRHAALMVASAGAWRDGGVGVKQGLALQRLAGSFGFSMNELHKVMAEAHAHFRA